MTETADAAATATQCVELAEAGSEMVRVTVNTPRPRRGGARDQAADARRGLRGAAHRRFPLQRPSAPRRAIPDAARALDKYRINPGNVGTGKRRDEQFATICKVAVDHGKPVRIGVNGGSLNQELVMAKMQENTDAGLGHSSDEIINECMVLSALQSTELALECRADEAPDHHLVQGLAAARSRSRSTAISRGKPTSRCTWASPKPAWASRASRGRLRRWRFCSTKASATRSACRSRRGPAAIGAKRCTRRAKSCRRSACARSRPSITACPGCGRTTSTTFQELAERVQNYVRIDDAGLEARRIRASRR